MCACVCVLYMLYMCIIYDICVHLYMSIYRYTIYLHVYKQAHVYSCTHIYTKPLIQIYVLFPYLSYFIFVSPFSSSENLILKSFRIITLT